MAVTPLIHVLSRDAIGGCETACLNLVSALQSEPFSQEVVFLTRGDGEGPSSRRLRELEVPTSYCPLEMGRVAFMRALASLCRNRQRPLVVCHAFGIHAFVAAAARLGGATKILAMAGNPPPANFRASLATTIYAQLGRVFVDREVGCTHYVAGEMQHVYRLPAQRLDVLAHAIPVDSIERRARVSRGGKRADSGPVVGMVARLDPIKDHATVLRAFSIVHHAVPSARLRLIGDGPQRAHLARLADEYGISNNVEFLGTRTDVPEQLGLLDVFVYGATRDEGFGIVLAEAMAARVPIVASDIGPCREVLGNGTAATLVPAGDPQRLAGALLAVLAGNAPPTVDTAFEWARQHYAPDVVARSFLSLLDAA